MKFLEAGATMADVFNEVRNVASYQYQNNVPVATPENTFQIVELLENTPQLRNEFADTLMTRIGRVEIKNRRYTNEMRPLHKGELRHGKTIQQIQTEIARVHDYDPTDTETLHRRELPDIRAAYHVITDKKYVKQTMSFQQLKDAVLNQDDLDRIFGSIIDAMYNAMEVYDSDAVKGLLTSAAKAGHIGIAVIQPVVDKISADNAAIAINELSDNMTFESTDYNYAKIHTFCPKENQVLILNTRLKNQLNMYVLAQSFNMEYADFNKYMTLMWRDFGWLDQFGACGFIGSKDYIQIWDALLEMPEPARNPQTLDANYFLHWWRNYFTDPFEPAVLLVDKMPVITEYTITPDATEIGKGDSVKFTITVKSDGIVNADSTFTLSGQKSEKTTINEYGYMVVGDDETAATITVKAVSKIDETKTATATVTVTGNA